MTLYPGHQQRARALKVSTRFSGWGKKIHSVPAMCTSDTLVYGMEIHETNTTEGKSFTMSMAQVGR